MEKIVNNKIGQKRIYVYVFALAFVIVFSFVKLINRPASTISVVVPVDTTDIKEVATMTTRGLSNYTVTTFQRAEMLNDQKFARPATNGSPIDPTPDWVKQQKTQTTK